MYMFLDIRCYPPPPSFRVAVIFFLELYMNIYINITIGYMSLNIRCTPPPPPPFRVAVIFFWNVALKRCSIFCLKYASK